MNVPYGLGKTGPGETGHQRKHYAGYVDDVALTSRCYEIGRGEIGVFVEYGKAVFTNTKLLVQEGTGK